MGHRAGFVTTPDHKTPGRISYPKLLAWTFGAQFLAYFVYLLVAVTSHGSSNWFQSCIWNIYGQVGGVLLIPFIPDSEASIGTLLIFAPLMGVVVYSIALATVIRVVRRTTSA